MHKKTFLLLIVVLVLAIGLGLTGTVLAGTAPGPRIDPALQEISFYDLEAAGVLKQAYEFSANCDCRIVDMAFYPIGTLPIEQYRLTLFYE